MVYIKNATDTSVVSVILLKEQMLNCALAQYLSMAAGGLVHKEFSLFPL